MMIPRKLLTASLAALALIGFASARADEAIEIKIGYLHARESKARLSLMDVPADNDGIAGAELAVDDNQTTGRFIGQNYSLIDADDQLR